MNYLIYTTVKDQAKAIPKLLELRTAKNKASARVVNFWYGEIESNYDVVYTGEGCEKVAEVYRKAGVEVKDLFEKPKKIVEPVVEVEIAQEPAVEPVQELPKEPARRGRPHKE